MFVANPNADTPLVVAEIQKAANNGVIHLECLAVSVKKFVFLKFAIPLIRRLFQVFLSKIFS